MSTYSIYFLITFFILFSVFSFAFSPGTAEIEPIVDSNSFLEGKLEKRIMVLTITGYSSSPDETDDTPWLTAYNTFPKWGTVASNILPYGTKIKIPSIFGDQIFIVEDKMNPRFDENIDIWFPSKEEALNFGIYKDVLVEILP